jgi:hypothetical protein
MNKQSIPKLVDQAKLSASLFDECDTALTELNEAFGTPYEASRKNLTNDLIVAEKAGIDLSVFQGEESLFKFPDFRTNIQVRITRVPTRHDKIEKIDTKITRLENELKLLKAERKLLIQRLLSDGVVDLLTDKIVTAFTRIK